MRLDKHFVVFTIVTMLHRTLRRRSVFGIWDLGGEEATDVPFARTLF